MSERVGGGEKWASKIGVILAVAGSAVGLGNFLRFPGKAATYGGGTFMIPYFISLLILGIPICWVEWTLGRQGGRLGFNSTPGIFSALIRHPAARAFGVLALIIPVVIYMYYVYIEAWCLAYAVDYLRGTLGALGGDPEAYREHFARFVGIGQDGAVFSQQGWGGAGTFLVIVFVINFVLIYRGLNRGIEAFCKWAMPLLILAAIVVLVRVLTLGTPDPTQPERNVINALGFMWNPKPIHAGEGTYAALANPQVWLEAAGQIFFSLSVGFGIVMTYASYLRRNDDVVLCGLSASSTNEFCEVCLGGLITVPAAFIFLGPDPLQGASTFSLGFFTLPAVFDTMPVGRFFGFLWFFLLFLAAVTSSLSMLQPAIAFLEEGFALGRRTSVACLGLITALGSLLVVYFSKDLVALDTMDFWVGSFCIFVLATVMVIVFGWVIGVDEGLKLAHEGADLRIPRVFKYVIKYVSPTYLLAIFGLWLWYNAGSYVRSIFQNQVALLTATFMVVVIAFFGVLVQLAAHRWLAQGRLPAVDSAVAED